MTVNIRNIDLISNNLKQDLQKWWLEIHTNIPQCTYYFGPFYSFDEALQYEEGFLEDLTDEGAIEITVNIKRCNPQNLTIEKFN